eukprot:9323614-Lingulodinium_polyedra.AAC.1
MCRGGMGGRSGASCCMRACHESWQRELCPQGFFVVWCSLSECNRAKRPKPPVSVAVFPCLQRMTRGAAGGRAGPDSRRDSLCVMTLGELDRWLVLGGWTRGAPRGVAARVAPAWRR